MLFFLLLCVLGFFLLIKAVKFYQEKRNLSKCVATIPGPKSYFLFSNMDVIKSQGKDCLPLLKKLLDQFKGICKLWVNTSIIVIIDDPDLVRDCLTSNNFLEKPFFYKFFRTPFGLLNSPYHYWRENRKLVNPTFNNKILQSFMPIFIDKTERMIEKLAQQKEDSEFNIFPYISHCTLKTVFSTSFGIFNDTDESLEDERQVINSINGIYAMVAKRMTHVYLYPDFFYKLTAFYREESKWFHIFYTYVRKVLKHKLAGFEESEKTQDATLQKPEERVKLKPQIFIEQLISISQNVHQLSSQEIEDQCTSIIFAGNETTALSTSYIVQMLAMHPKFQQQLFEEINEVWPSTSQLVNEELLKKLTYMDLCIKETMRLFPVGAILGRVPMAEGKLGPYTVCPGTVILINAFQMHRRKDIWGEDAELFNPQRFTSDNSEHRHPFAYIPFSAGPRNCIGYRYAILALKTMLLNLVKNFEFTSNLKYEEMKVKFSITLKNELGYYVKMKRRTNSNF